MKTSFPDLGKALLRQPGACNTCGMWCMQCTRAARYQDPLRDTVRSTFLVGILVGIFLMAFVNLIAETYVG